MSQAPPPTEWILAEGQPWARVIALRDLLGHAPGDSDLKAAQEEMLAHPLVVGLLAEVSAWPGRALKRHNDAAHPLHKLAALAEFGLTRAHPQIAPAVDFILAYPSEEGVFQTMLHVPERYGGDGKDHLIWMLCDAPTVLHAVLRLGVPPDEPAMVRAVDHLASLVRENGWPCASAPAFGTFRGPGRKGDPCPYANLVALKALALAPGMADSDAARAGVGALLWHWDIQKERKVYMFGLGTDFRKPKYPLIWYDILHVTDVLTRFPFARMDPRLRAMVDELRAQADVQGRFTAGSMYRAWKEWDFANKKTPSPTITATAWRVLGRMQGA
jgi:hypothetical protein